MMATDMGMAQDIAQNLGDEYVPVRADELANLYSQGAGKQTSA